MRALLTTLLVGAVLASGNASAATSFQQAQTTQVSENGFNFDVYLWSTAANWTNGVPIAGDQVTHNITVSGNPSGLDDIANLSIDTLNLTAGQVAVGGSLSVGTVNFGSTNFPSLFSDTLLGSPAAAVTIGTFTGSVNSAIGAFGPNAITTVLSTTDPGATYQVDDGGELVVTAFPNIASGFYYENSVANGTFAFKAGGGTISAALGGVAIGDSIALPGSLVESVTYGINSIVVVTNAGTTTFSNVSYSGTQPTSFTTSTDTTGLIRITFSSTAATSFQQAQTTQVSENGFNFDVYLWSTAANWTNGVPASGGVVTHNITVPGNPSGLDDIASLSIDTLNLTAGQVAVGGNLRVGTVNFGSVNFPSVFSDTLLGSSAASVTIGTFTGSVNSAIGAFGPNAITTVLASSDPGATYQVDDGGELVVTAFPNIASGFYYENSVANGTFAFKTSGGTISAALGGVAIGDSVALPGSFVQSVTYGINSIVVATNAGTTTFSNVSYSGTQPTGYTTSTDTATGLIRITFAQSTATAFQQAQTTQISENGFNFDVYLWSTAANWTNGVPVNGGVVTHNITVSGNPSGLDDIANLSIDTLNLTAGQVAVGGNLRVGTVNFGSVNFPSVFSDTLLGSSAASVTIGTFTGSVNSAIGAFGPNAITTVLASSDPGATYQVDDGGELVVTAFPNIASGFYYENSVANGTFAFKAGGGTISAALGGVAIGDSIALPGSLVESVTYNSTSIVVTTNAGTTTFSNVSYSGTQPTSFASSTDAATGLIRITFAATVATSFQQAQTTQVSENGFNFDVYLWSSAANWTNGVPASGGVVTHNITVPGNPSGLDDIANLSIDTLNVTAGQVAVGGNLRVGTVNFGSVNFPSLFSDTLLGSSAASVTIGTFTGSVNSAIGAFGPNAITTVLARTDPGATYQVDDGGELVLVATPNTSSGFYFENSVANATFAFLSPSSIDQRANALVHSPLAGVAIGDSIALPGTFVDSVTYGPSSIVVVTNAGMTTFTNVSYSGTQPTNFTTSPDTATGLIRITFAPASYALTVSLGGGGSGSVGSSPSGIGCSPACEASYASGTSVVLTALASPGSVFTGWTGCDTPNGNQCTVMMSSTRSVSASFVKNVFADLNGDGKSDIVWRNADGSAAVWLMNGLSIGTSQQILAAGTGFSIAHLADFNGDGKTDLFFQHPDGRAIIWLMNGATKTANAKILDAGTGWTAVQVADLDGDGKADIVWQNTDGSTAVWLMNGTAMSSGGTIMGPGTGWSVTQTGDFDGDGKADLVWTNTDGRVAIWLMNGATPTTTTQILNAGSGWSVARVADLDGDGKADIVWQNTDGSTAVWLMNGTAMTSGGTIMGPGTGWSVAATGDFNGDGKQDLYWQNADGRAAIWLMNGLTTITGAQILNAASGWSLARLADLDGDGKADIIWQNTDGSVAAWLMNGASMASGLGLLGPATGWSVNTSK